ncbi:MAG: hypothetical protein EAX86_06300 [Candidatus Heimdallarchaeota archaeon]|nr:hypothetical protein [Candidatus Heimdallarchaeota archaeon]
MDKSKVAFWGLVIIIIGITGGLILPVLPSLAKMSSNDLEIKYSLVINRITGKELYSDLYDTFESHYWPLIAPTDITVSNYAAPFTFNSTNGINTTDNLYYGNAYRGKKLIGENRKTFLILSQSVFESEETLNESIYSLYENFSWSYSVYVEHTDDEHGVDRLILSFRSIIDPVDSQVWSGWFIWTYNSERIAERFDLIVWRIDATLVNSYDPLTNPDKSNLTAYYEFTYEVPGIINESLAFVFIFMGGVCSILIAPFILIGFIVRRPIKQYVTTERIPQTNLIPLIEGRRGNVKLITGIVILTTFLGFQFIFPSNTATLLVSVLLSGFLWFGPYLVLRSIIELRNKASVRILPIGLIIIISIVIGYINLQNLQAGIGLYINPNMFESVIFVSSLFYGTTFGALTAFLLIYEAFYISNWNYDPNDRSFIIERNHPFSKAKESINIDNLAEITINIENRRSRYSTYKVAILRLVGKPEYKSKQQSWQLTNSTSYQQLFNTIETLKNYKLISDYSLETTTKQTEYLDSQIADKERWMKLEEKYPELKKQRPNLIILEEQMKTFGINIEHKVGGDISLFIAGYKHHNQKSLVINFVLFAAITVILLISPILPIRLALQRAFINAMEPIIFFGITMFVLGCFSLYKCTEILQQIMRTRSQTSVFIELTSDSLSLHFNSLDERKAEKYQLFLLCDLDVRRNHFSGVKISLSKEYSFLPLLYFNDREFAKIISDYISYYAYQSFITTKSNEI